MVVIEDKYTVNSTVETPYRCGSKSILASATWNVIDLVFRFLQIIISSKEHRLNTDPQRSSERARRLHFQVLVLTQDGRVWLEIISQGKNRHFRYLRSMVCRDEKPHFLSMSSPTRALMSSNGLHAPKMRPSLKRFNGSLANRQAGRIGQGKTCLLQRHH